MRHRLRRALAALASFVLVALAGGCARAPAAASPVTPRPVAGRVVAQVIVVSIDGLMPEAYLRSDELGLGVPTLRGLVAQGAWSAGVTGVYPTVTYPTHTTIVTGAEPRVHGVFGNTVLDPLETSDKAWHWYAEAIRVPTLWQIVEAAGGRAAAVFWPVTVGARMALLVPEYWRSKHPVDLALLRALSTPGLLEAVAAGAPGLWARLAPAHVTDAGLTDIAVHLVEHERPTLLLLHLAEVDAAQHEHGPRSAQALAAIENADAQVARLVAASTRAGTRGRTVFVVLSDHGFTTITQRVRPGAVLRGLGLATVPARGGPGWRVGVVPSGGQAYLYLADADDHDAETRATQAFVALAAQPGSGIAAVHDRAAIVARGGDPAAFLGLESADGFAFAAGYGGPVIEPSGYKGHHGFAAERREMQASLIVVGPGVRAGKELIGARMIDVGPTIAALLGLRLPAATGEALRLD